MPVRTARFLINSTNVWGNCFKQAIVVLDFRLPDSNDLNLLRTIRNVSPTTAVVMMTAFGSADIAAGARRLGAYCVVPKPFEVDHIAALVVEAHRGDVSFVNSHDRPLGGFR
jgi:DNA-binding NtrC family response regulator